MLKPVLTETKPSRFAHVVSKHYRVVLAGAILISLLSLLWARQLSLESNIVALLPEDSPSVLELNRLTEKLGGTGDLQIMIRSPDSQRSIEYAESLLATLRRMPWVEHASMGNPTEFFDARKLLYVDLDDLEVIKERVEERVKYETLAAHPFFIDLDDAPPPSLDFSDIEDKYRGGEARSKYFSNPSGTILLILVQPKGMASDLPYAQWVQGQMQTLVGSTDPTRFHPAMTVDVGGAYRNRINEYEAISRDVESSSIVVAIAIVLLIVLYFGRVWAAFVVMVPLLMSLCWTFAVAFVSLEASISSPYF